MEIPSICIAVADQPVIVSLSITMQKEKSLISLSGNLLLSLNISGRVKISWARHFYIFLSSHLCCPSLWRRKNASSSLINTKDTALIAAAIWSRAGMLTTWNPYAGTCARKAAGIPNATALITACPPAQAATSTSTAWNWKTSANWSAALWHH